jgi:hypothetical protein
MKKEFRFCCALPETKIQNQISPQKLRQHSPLNVFLQALALSLGEWVTHVQNASSVAYLVKRDIVTLLLIQASPIFMSEY